MANKTLTERISGAFFSFACGIGAYAIMSLADSPRVTGVKIFEREDNLPIMRLYGISRDAIYIQDDEDNSSYVPLKEYLWNIEGEADRKLEEAKIKKFIGWYKQYE